MSSTPMSSTPMDPTPMGAQLVRPDGIPVATWWSADDAAENLCRARASVFSPSSPLSGLMPCGSSPS